MMKIGEIFGRMTVLELLPERLAKCVCECGTTKEVKRYNLTRGLTKSCGCLRREATTKSKTTHGMHDTRTYRIWANMLNRCSNSKIPDWKYYGGRGIKVCEEWLSFENFFRDMGEAPEMLSIDRKNTDDGYHKENCRWATAKEQANNRRTATQRPVKVKVLYEGAERTVSELMSILHLPEMTIRGRIRRGTL